MSATNTTAALLAFDFYDGPTEGLIRAVLGVGPCYFKMLAWDEEQDVRLYGVVSIDAHIFDELVERAARNSSRSAAPVRLRAQPASQANERDLDQQIERWIEQLPQSGFLVCGTAIDSPDAKRYSFPDSLKSRAADMAKSKVPESLSDWRSHLM